MAFDAGGNLYENPGSGSTGAVTEYLTNGTTATFFQNQATTAVTVDRAGNLTAVTYQGTLLQHNASTGVDTYTQIFNHPFGIAPAPGGGFPSVTFLLLLVGAYSSLRTRLNSHVISPWTGTLITTNDSDNPVRTAALSPDGRLLAYADSTGVLVREMETGRTHVLKAPKNKCCTHGLVCRSDLPLDDKISFRSRAR